MRTVRPGLYGGEPLATVRFPQRGLSSHSLSQNNQKTEHTATKTNIT